MDNKQQQKAGSLERPQGDVNEIDPKEDSRRYKAHQKAITRGLKRFYDDVASEPVPDEFMALLKKMDESTR
ncbi:hypothetical protein FHS83_002543 [Rhizomicrobium palustre]|uniref:Anti-sigma factor NepR domain-containing protein n=1 Tax=Rhizomicrobium palustre TaxID=189966 RepID=A0A846N185_9PROT|nr:NepR family anti-sigma factor [Rhizomicrobium palustre]NIK89225.1 hypothetical protein [Rhizomicrobium palustre]